MHSELLELVTLMRHFIQEKTPYSFKKSSTLPAKKMPPPPLAKVEVLPPPPPPQQVEKKAEAPAPFEAMKGLLQKLFPSHFLEEIPSFFYLVSFTQNAQDELFFKKLSVALTASHVPTQFLLLKEKKELLSLFNMPRCKLLIGSSAEMQKHLPHSFEKRHTLVKVENKPFFLLENPSLYAKDLKLKHALWNALLQLPLSDLL